MKPQVDLNHFVKMMWGKNANGYEPQICPNLSIAALENEDFS